MASKNFQLRADTSGFGRVSAAVRQKLGKAVRKALLDIEGSAKDAIQSGPKTGRIYGAETEVSFATKGGAEVSFTAYKGKAGHQASAPGEAPATDTGHLANTIGIVMKAPTSGEVVAPAEYAAPLEFGTDDGRIAPRPFIGPAVEDAEPGFIAACAAAVREGAEG